MCAWQGSHLFHIPIPVTIIGLLWILNCRYIGAIKLSQNENNIVYGIYFCDNILADKVSYGEEKEPFTLTICQSSLYSATWWQCPQKLYSSTNIDNPSNHISTSQYTHLAGNHFIYT